MEYSNEVEVGGSGAAADEGRAGAEAFGARPDGVAAQLAKVGAEQEPVTSVLPRPVRRRRNSVAPRAATLVVRVTTAGCGVSAA